MITCLSPLYGRGYKKRGYGGIIRPGGIVKNLDYGGTK
jgi:hypothetical protein